MVAVREDLFAARYALGEVLGSGGSGVVRRAHDTVLDRPVAVKLLRTGADDDVMRARLRAEAQLAGSLHHPGIAQIYDYGEVVVRDEPTPYIVMQYVEGTPLSALLRETRALPVSDVMDFVAQIAEALRAAHTAGIIHRDLKPSNVLVTEAGRAVLVDFGIARTSDAEPLTMTGTLVGTADYISPEQCSGRQATPRSDLYSLGMLAYQCLTGHKPFHRESPLATALAHLHDEVPPLTDVPPAVAALVGQLVEKDPEERPVDAAEVAVRARALTGDATRVAPGVVLPPRPSPEVAAAARRPFWRSEGFRSRRLQIAAAAVAVTLLGTIFVAARPATTRVPDLEGLSWGEARQVLAARGLAVERQRVDDPGTERGTVLAQDPAPGAAPDEQTVVVLEVASGKTVLDPDEVVGLTYDEAARILVRLGLVPVRNEVSRPGGDGTVVTALPVGRLRTGTMVTLTVGLDGAVTEAAPTPSAPATSSSGSSGSGSTSSGTMSTSKPQKSSPPGHGSSPGNGKAKAQAKKR